MNKPEIDFPDFDPPADLVVTDLTVGDGPEAAAGQTVSVHYVGVAHSTGEEFDAVEHTAAGHALQRLLRLDRLNAAKINLGDVLLLHQLERARLPDHRQRPALRLWRSKVVAELPLTQRRRGESSHVLAQLRPLDRAQRLLRVGAGRGRGGGVARESSGGGCRADGGGRVDHQPPLSGGSSGTLVRCVGTTKKMGSSASGWPMSDLLHTPPLV